MLLNSKPYKKSLVNKRHAILHFLLTQKRGNERKKQLLAGIIQKDVIQGAVSRFKFTST